MNAAINHNVSLQSDTEMPDVQMKDPYLGLSNEEIKTKEFASHFVHNPAEKFLSTSGRT